MLAQTSARISRAALLSVYLATPSAQGCEWYFRWSCQGCANIGGASEDRYGPYPTQSACESARRQVHHNVTAYVCQSSGNCTTTKGSTSGDFAGPEPLIDYSNPGAQEWQNEMDRIRRETIQTSPPTPPLPATAIPAANTPVHDNSEFIARKRKLQSILKQTDSAAKNDDNAVLPKSPSLKLKSGTSTFGIKPNPSGRLKTASGARGQAQAERVIRDSTDLAFPTDPAKRRDWVISRNDFSPPVYSSLKTEPVPVPAAVATGSYLSFVFSSSTDLILDAIEAADGDLDVGIRWLEQQEKMHNAGDLYAQQAISYLEGLRNSYIAADEAYQRSRTIESTALLWAVLSSTNDARGKGAPANGPSWKSARTSEMLTALEQANDSLIGALKRLQKQGSTTDGRAAGNGYQYLVGTYAYWSFLEMREQGSTAAQGNHAGDGP